MNRFWGAIAAVFACLAGGSAEAGDAERRAREEVERELAELVNVPRARVRILYQGLDEPQMKLEALELLLDGKPLKVSNLGALDRFGEHVVYRGDLPEGRHELITRVVYVDSSSVLISELAGFKWKVSSAVRFETRDGLEVTVRAVPEKVPDEDVRKQLRVKHAMGVAMVAEVDTTVPEPLKRKPVVVAQAEETSPVEAEATELDDVAAAPAPEREEEGGTSKQAEVARKTRPGKTRSTNRRRKRPRVANAARAGARRTNDARGMRMAASRTEGRDEARGGAADGQRGVVAAAGASAAREGGADSRGDRMRGDPGDAEGTGTGAGNAGEGESATAAGPAGVPGDPRAELPEPSAPEGEEAPSTTGAAQARVPAPEALEPGGAAEARQASEEAPLIPMPVYAGGMVALLLALVGVLMRRRK